MRVVRPFQLNVVLCALLAACAAPGQESPYRSTPGGYPRFDAKQAEPGVLYGHVPDFPLPRTLLYSVSVDELLADADAWVKQGYQGFFLTGLAGEWSSDIWAADGKPWTIGKSDETLQKVRQATDHCRERGAEVFLSTSFSHPFDWFDDVAWQQIEHRFRQMAIFARESGCTGLAIDIEYINQQYHFTWDGYSYEGYSRRDLVNTLRRRMTGVAESMYDAFPEMVLLTLPEGMLSLGSQIQTAWIEVAAKRNAPGGVHICTEYSYRRPNVRFMLGHAWMINDLMDRALSKEAMAYWREHGSVAEGIWVFGDDPDDFHGAPPTAAEFRQAFAASLMAGRRYNWIYSHNVRPWLLGRDAGQTPKPPDLDAYLRVVSEREIATDSPYLRIASAVRQSGPADYEDILGLTIVPTFAGPREELEEGLMPLKLYVASPQSETRAQLWDVGMAIYNGDEVNAKTAFGTLTNWQIIGPFDNTDNKGYGAVYPPEEHIDLAAACDTPRGPVSWRTYSAPAGHASVNLTDVLQPSEWVCAYALCYVDSPVDQPAQIRLGANDGWKLWAGGQLVMEYPDDGRVILDREVVPVTLKKGVMPILLKVCNKKKDWGFILRITGPQGAPLTNIHCFTTPPK